MLIYHLSFYDMFSASSEMFAISEPEEFDTLDFLFEIKNSFLHESQLQILLTNFHTTHYIEKELVKRPLAWALTNHLPV
jgi:hypothetical protein